VMCHCFGLGVHRVRTDLVPRALKVGTIGTHLRAGISPGIP
jgi:hypothetical protein